MEHNHHLKLHQYPPKPLREPLVSILLSIRTRFGGVVNQPLDLSFRLSPSGVRLLDHRLQTALVRGEPFTFETRRNLDGSIVYDLDIHALRLQRLCSSLLTHLRGLIDPSTAQKIEQFL